MEEAAQRIRGLAHDLCPGKPLGEKGCAARGLCALAAVGNDPNSSEPAIEVAKNEGVEIELVYDSAHHPHSSLTLIADVRKELSQADIDSVKK